MPDFGYLMLALFVVFIVALTAIFRLEKRMVWPFGELEAATPQLTDPTGYAQRWLIAAQNSGFRMLGWSRDLKFAKWGVYYALLISADQATLAVIGCGKMMNVPLTATWIYTPLTDGRTFYSTDNQSGVSIDLSGNWRNQLAFERGFAGLLAKHNQWLRSSGVSPRKFTAGRELTDLRAVREEHFRAMERAGLIRYVSPAAVGAAASTGFSRMEMPASDGSNFPLPRFAGTGMTAASGEQFQFTLSGALRTAPWSYFAGLARRVSGGRWPRTT